MSEIFSLTTIIGGASSGKSSFAETFVKRSSGPRYYLATAQAYDAEMASKISQHQSDREKDGWTTIEEPLEVTKALSQIPDGADVLMDCATMWLNNLIMDGRDTATETEKLTDFLTDLRWNLTIVSNEVGLGIVPENKLARAFRISQGRLNAKLAAQSDLVVTVIAGLPLALKGRLP